MNELGPGTSQQTIKQTDRRILFRCIRSIFDHLQSNLKVETKSRHTIVAIAYTTIRKDRNTVWIIACHLQQRHRQPRPQRPLAAVTPARPWTSTARLAIRPPASSPSASREALERRDK